MTLSFQGVQKTPLSAASPRSGGHMSQSLWRPMRATDLAAVHAIAGEVHVAHPERPQVCSERLRPYAAGCFVLAGPGGEALGYAVSHPWRDGEAPALDTLIGALPRSPTTFHIHDIALVPAARRRGAARAIIIRLIARARDERLAGVSLVAVNGTAPLWQAFGFRPGAPAGPADTLHTYGSDAAYMTLALERAKPRP